MYKKYAEGGYASVYLDVATNTIEKHSSFVYDDSTGSFHHCAIGDAIISRAIANCDCIPLINAIKCRYADRSIRVYMPFYGQSLYSAPPIVRRQKAMVTLESLARACLHLYENGIQHTDIKHSNVLVLRNDITLIDFNIFALRMVHPEYKWTSSIGTWSFVAPEICIDMVPQNTSMVWSIGMMMVYLYGGMIWDERIVNDESPHEDWIEHMKDVMKHNMIGPELPKSVLTHMPYPLSILFHKCTYWDWNRRMTLRDLYNSLCLLNGHVPDVPQSVQTSFTMTPDHNTRRFHYLVQMREWCEENKRFELLIRSIGTFDRINDILACSDIPAVCIAIHHMLMGNHILSYDQDMISLLERFHIPNTQTLMKRVCEVLDEMDWDIYELPADVILQDELPLCTSYNIIDSLYQALLTQSEPYTMKTLAATVFKEMYPPMNSS